MNQLADTIRLPLTGTFRAARTLDCGQCFRWTPKSDGSWLGVVRGIPARVLDKDGALLIQTLPETYSLEGLF